jgi:hypothetical protein
MGALEQAFTAKAAQYPNKIEMRFLSDVAGKVVICHQWTVFNDLIKNEIDRHSLHLSKSWLTTLKSLEITQHPRIGWYVRQGDIYLYLGANEAEALNKL